MDISSIRMKNMVALMKRYRSQSEFAEAVDTAQAYISQLLSGSQKAGKERKLGDKFARKIEERLRLPYGWMDVSHAPVSGDVANTAEAPATGRVPLLDWDDFSTLSEGSDSMHGGNEKVRMITTSGDYGPRAFALAVGGDSMSPDFMPGSMIIVDPGRDAEPNQYVVADLNGSKTFRQLVKDGSDLYLRPINPQYPVRLLGDGTIVGVVVESVSVRRLI